MANDLPPYRKRLRAEGVNYAVPNGYFVTICTHHRRSLFGHITESVAELSPAGVMVWDYWTQLAQRFPFVEIDAFVVMPNHVHGIVVLQPVDGEIPPKSLSQIIGAFKSTTTIAYKRALAVDGWEAIGQHLWQRSFHDRIIRSERHLERLREYVESNPDRWLWDEENPERIPASRLTPPPTGRSPR